MDLGSPLNSPGLLQPGRSFGCASEFVSSAGSECESSASIGECCKCIERHQPGPPAGYALLVFACCAITAWNFHAVAQYSIGRDALAERSCHPDAFAFKAAAADNRRAHRHGAGGGDGGCGLNVSALLHLAGQLTANLTADSLQRAGTSQQWHQPSAEVQFQAHEDPVLAHLRKHGFDSRVLANNNEMLLWAHDERRKASLVGNIMYNDGQLTVEESGYYFVYSQVTFVMELKDVPLQPEPAVHELVRRRNGVKETLAKAERTLCWSAKPTTLLAPSGYSVASSFIGLVIHFQNGDSLSVQVKDVNFVWQTGSKTFWGAHFLSK